MYARTVKAPKGAKLTKATESMAKPLPRAAVVLPAASNKSRQLANLLWQMRHLGNETF